MKTKYLSLLLACLVAGSSLSANNIGQFPPRPVPPPADVPAPPPPVAQGDVEALNFKLAFKAEVGLSKRDWTISFETVNGKTTITVEDHKGNELFSKDWDGKTLVTYQVTNKLSIYLGTPKIDVITVDEGVQGIVFALAGDDVVTGGDLDDYIFLGSGNDQCQAGDGEDYVYGGAGNDLISGNGGSDELFGEGGLDKLFGDDGTDTLVLGLDTELALQQEQLGQTIKEHEKELEGLKEDLEVELLLMINPDLIKKLKDEIEGLEGKIKSLTSTQSKPQTAVGGAGDDQIWGSELRDNLLGSEDDDTIRTVGGADLVWGFGGGDKIWIAECVDPLVSIDGGDGWDDIHLFENNGTIKAGKGDDKIYCYSSNGSYIIHCGDGNDQVFYGGKHADHIYGGKGNDILDGGEGVDNIFGGAGVDNIYGNKGEDYLYGEAGGDFIWGGSGVDHISGGADDDKLWGDKGGVLLLPEEVEGGDYIAGHGGHDEIWGEGGNDFIWGNDGYDKLYGGKGDDQIDGGEGADTLMGEAGEDTLIDRSGGFIDTLIGGPDNDKLDCWDNKLTNFDIVVGEAGTDSFWVDDDDRSPDWAGWNIEPFVALNRSKLDLPIGKMPKEKP